MALDDAAERGGPVGEGQGAVDEAVGAEAEHGDAGEAGGIALEDRVEEMGGADGEGADVLGGGGEAFGEKGDESGFQALGDVRRGGGFLGREDGRGTWTGEVEKDGVGIGAWRSVNRFIPWVSGLNSME